MRIVTALACAALLTAPALAQDAEGYVWPVPEVSSDLSVLPEAARAKRQALVDAARTGDIENLRAIMDAQEYPPNVSFGAPDDPIAFLKDVSEDAEGRQVMGLLIDLLDQPFAWYGDSGGATHYVWPYLAELDPNNLTPEQQVDAYRLLDMGQLQELQNIGAWYYWRVYIREDGEWSAFVAGD